MGRFTDPITESIKGRFSDPMSEQILARQKLAISCLWKPKPEHKFFEDKLGRYYFDKDLVDEVIKAKQFVNLKKEN